MHKTKNQAKFWALTAALSATLLAARVLPALACATLAPDPKDSVNVVDESAIIIWDAAKKREHFIRGATFESSAKDIGFIGPTPSTPELSSARREAFGILEKALEPKVEHRVNRGYIWSLFLGRGGSDKTESATATTANTVENATSDAPEKPRRTTASVRVLQTRQVAGYDATTLKADDVGALSRWLHKNGYVLTGDFRDWLQPYVRDGWVVTAFKIRKQNNNQKQFSSALVRMSFDAEKPFYPYREPASARKNHSENSTRSLRVFFIGDERVSGAIGENSQRDWPGKAQWSDKLSDHLNQSQRANLAQQLAINPKQFSAKARLTSFEDFSSPRPGFDEVYFSPSAKQDKILPAPLIIETNKFTYIPLDLIFILAVIAFFIARAVIGRRKARLSPTLS